MLNDLTDYIQTQGLGTIGQTLFEYFQPDRLDNLYMLNTPGGVVGEDNKYLPVKTITISVITRNSDKGTAKTKAEAMSTLLHSIRNTTIGSTYFYYILKNQEPQPLGNDSGGRYEWSQNFQCMIR